MKYGDRNSRNKRSNNNSRANNRMRNKKDIKSETNKDGDGEGQIEGRNPVLEALRSQRTIDKLLVARGSRDGTMGQIISQAKKRNIVIQEVDRRRLDELSMTRGSHQGVIAFVTPYSYVELDDILDGTRAKNEPPFIIILDEITDPHNLGSIIRTGECCGAHGIIIPKRRAAGLTPAVIKASAGAVEFMPVAKVTNISQTIEILKKQGVWVAGADMDGELYSSRDLTGPIALVIGSEGKGLSRLVKEKCDFLISIPLRGKISSLNASVAAGILMYEVDRQRGKA